ncbi:MAG: hypothetical protein AAB556_02255 [Patescibacteria group bacterium]|mgnify:CR=1 FL=1
MRKCLAAACIMVIAVTPISNHDKQELEVKNIETVTETFDRLSKSFDGEIKEIGHAITNAESDFRNICNTEGCRYGIGPMQIVRSTFEEQCQGNVFNQEDNIKCGLTMLKRGHYWRWYQSVDKWFLKLSKKAQKRILP